MTSFRVIKPEPKIKTSHRIHIDNEIGKGLRYLFISVGHVEINPSWLFIHHVSSTEVKIAD